MVQTKGILVHQSIICAHSIVKADMLTSTNVLFQLGANAILAVSLAVCKAGASALNIPLYKVN